MKHAFLVVAHTNYPLLSRIIKKIDHPDNTIYIHIDVKSVLTDKDIEMLKGSCVFSEVHFIERYKATWGGYSLVNLELRLYEAAIRKGFDYYHLISGADFLIKPMEEFHRFFEENNGFEFVEFWSESYSQKLYGRVSRYNPFRDLCGRNKKNPLYWINSAIVRFQRYILHTDRLKKFPHIQAKCGGNWCSITHDFATYLVSREALIRKLFLYTDCSDEWYIQTMLFSSPFAKNAYGSKLANTGQSANLRSIDWSRPGRAPGSPHTYTVADYEELISSGNMFCRKVTDEGAEEEALIRKLESLGVSRE